jgi:hypothetical protein
MIENNDRMRVIPVENEELLEVLNQSLLTRTSDIHSFKENAMLTGNADPDDKFVSDEYLHDIISMGRKHDGFPETIHGYELRFNQKEKPIFLDKNRSPSYKLTSEKIKYREFAYKNISSTNLGIMDILGCRNNALHAVYPPGGYIAWHNNANAAAWNLIFTWSETGEGYFKYWDIEKKEVVYMQDKPGWSLKAGYFGHYGEPEKLMYHAAKTKCWRHTISYIYDRREVSKDFREDLLTEISSK